MRRKVAGMAKNGTKDRASFRCTECGWTSLRWVGRCGECQSWGSVSEVGAPSAASMRPGAVTAPAIPITSIDLREAVSTPSGLGELDRVLGGG